MSTDRKKMNAQPLGSASGETRPGAGETPFFFRDIAPNDKDEVLALAALTWNGGDYIHWVFDGWVSDTSGRFLAAVERETGRLAGIDKLSFLSTTEAWFEGLRVHPDFQGRGLATQMQTYMIGEARRLGALTVRFLTNTGNTSVHRKAYRDGFTARFVARHWRWLASEEAPQAANTESSSQFDLRAATPDQAPLLYEWWKRSPSWRATGGLVNTRWSYSAASPGAWLERATRCELLVPQSTDIAKLAAPPPTALITRLADGGDPYFEIAMLSAMGGEWSALAQALVRLAKSENIGEIEGLVCDNTDAYLALQAAGFTSGGEHECLCLFELSL